MTHVTRFLLAVWYTSLCFTAIVIALAYPPIALRLVAAGIQLATDAALTVLNA